MHVYGSIQENFQSTCRDLAFPLHHFPWTDSAHHAGFARDSALLLRPDGYVALALPTQDVDALGAFVNEFALQFRGA